MSNRLTCDSDIGTENGGTWSRSLTICSRMRMYPVSSSIFEMSPRESRRSRLQREYSRALEDKVQERTGELKAKNEQLEQTLSQLKDAQNQLIIREKLASVGALVAGVAHEVNTPIGAVISAADLSDRGLNKVFSLVETAESIERLKQEAYLKELMVLLKENNRVIANAAERVSRTVRNLKNFARLDEAELQWADVHEGIDSTLNLVEYELKNKATLIKDYGKVPKILCYPNQLNQLFLNLLRNAVEALNPNGTITIETRADSGSALDQDCGHGQRNRAREPSQDLRSGLYHQGCRNRNGTGLVYRATVSFKSTRVRFRSRARSGKERTFTVTSADKVGSRPGRPASRIS